MVLFCARHGLLIIFHLCPLASACVLLLSAGGQGAWWAQCSVLWTSTAGDQTEQREGSAPFKAAQSCLLCAQKLVFCEQQRPPAPHILCRFSLMLAEVLWRHSCLWLFLPSMPLHPTPGREHLVSRSVFSPSTASTMAAIITFSFLGGIELHGYHPCSGPIRLLLMGLWAMVCAHKPNSSVPEPLPPLGVNRACCTDGPAVLRSCMEWLPMFLLNLCFSGNTGRYSIQQPLLYRNLPEYNCDLFKTPQVKP